MRKPCLVLSRATLERPTSYNFFGIAKFVYVGYSYGRMISFEEKMHCKGIYSPIGECKCRCTVMTDSAITMQLTYYRGHFHRLLPSPRTGQGCQVTVEGRQAYLPVARREAEALKLQASLKELTCVGDSEGQGDPDGFQELTPMRRPPGARATGRAMCTWGAPGRWMPRRPGRRPGRGRRKLW